MDPLMRKLFQPREAREKLRGMGGIMSSSPQLASTVAKFQQGGPIQAMAPERSDLGGAMPLASAIHGPSGMMYGEMSQQQLSALANSGDRLAAEILMMLQPSAGVQPVELETTAVAPATLEEGDEFLTEQQKLDAIVAARSGGTGSDEGRRGPIQGVVDFYERQAEETESDRAAAGLPSTLTPLQVEQQLEEQRVQAGGALGVTSGPGAGLDAITGDDLLPPSGLAEETPVEEVQDPTPTPAPTIDVDLNDPSTYDTDFDEMMRRLGGATGKDDKSSRQKAMADLAMIGLAIAAGQSPDALTNIAQGALTGMKAIRAEDAAKDAVASETRALAAKLATDKEIARMRGSATSGVEDTRQEYLYNATFNSAFQSLLAEIDPTDPNAIEEISKRARQVAANAAPGAPSARGAAATTAALPEVTTQEQFDALPAGAEFTQNGQRRRKPAE